MSWAVVGALLLAALMHAAWNALLKARPPGQARAISPPLVASTGLSVCWALLGWPLVLCAGPLPWAAWPALLGSVGVHLVYFTLLAAAYRQGDLSVVYPLARGVPPLLVTVAGMLWGDRPSALLLAGVGAIALGVLGLQSAPASPRSVLFALSSALCTAAYTLLDGHAVRISADPWSYTAHLVALQGTAFSLGSLLWGGAPLARAVVGRARISLLAGLLSGGGYGVALWAMGRAPIAAVAALRETSVVFAAWIAVFALGETLDRRRLLATALIAGGAVAVRAGA
jgi:drug/metabolite transporter (DMT)-like permease